MGNLKITLRQMKHEAKAAEWRTKIRDCRNSGLQIKEWCAANGINVKTYYRWQRQIWDEETGKERKEPPKFIELPEIKLEGESKSIGIIIRNGGWQIELPNNANPELVRQIMETAARYV